MRMGEREGKEEDEVVEWQRWERGVNVRFQGFFGNRTMLICAFSNSPKQRAGPSSGLPRNYGPYRPSFDATWYCTPNIRRPLRNTIKAQ